MWEVSNNFSRKTLILLVYYFGNRTQLRFSKINWSLIKQTVVYIFACLICLFLYLSMYCFVLVTLWKLVKSGTAMYKWMCPSEYGCSKSYLYVPECTNYHKNIAVKNGLSCCIKTMNIFIVIFEIAGLSVLLEPTFLFHICIFSHIF